MSISNLHRQTIKRISDELARLQRERSREAGKVAELTRKINSASRSASRSTNASTVNMKLRDVERYQNEITRVQKKIADIEAKIARKQGELNQARARLVREEDRELRKRQREEKELARRHERHLAQMRGQLATHETLHERTLSAIEKLQQLPEKIVILFLAANPLDQVQLRLDEEVRAIAEMIRKAKHRDSVKLESCWAVRPMDILQAINEHKPAIVHFSGHGSNCDELVFQDDSGQTKLVTKEAMVQTMMACSGDIRLVFFNTCYSRNQAEAVVSHVDASIGMTTSIGDVGARVFAAQFYSAIGFGLSVKTAFDQAKAALMLEGIPEEKTPELFVRQALGSEELIIVRPPGDQADETGT